MNATKQNKNYILEYYQKILDGSVTVGRWIRLLYEYLVTGLDERRFYFDQKKANHAIEWIETHCFHTKGKLAPGNLKLELWQKALISSMFGIVDEAGKRVFSEVILIVARKNGKSLLASCICNYLFRASGEYGAEIYTIAPKLDQSAIVFDCTYQMIQLDPDQIERRERIAEERLATHMKVEEDPELVRKRVSDIYFPATNSVMKKLPFASKRSDGLMPLLAVADEIAAWEGEKGLRQYEVLASAVGAREEPIILSCSTAGYVSDSIYDELTKRATRFLLGDSKETHLLPFLYMVDDPEKWDDINELQKSNPNLGVSIKRSFLLDEIIKAEGSLSKRNEVLTKYANIKQNSSLAWLSAKTVERASGPAFSLDDLANNYCVCGIDLSQTRDLSSACIVVEKDGEFYVVSHFWLPGERIDEASQRDGLPYNIYIQRGLLSPSGDNFIDYEDVYRWVVDLVEKYQLLPLRVGYDRYSAQYLIKSLEQYGFVCDDVYQGENLYGVLQEMEGYLEDGKVHIGDNDLLKVHLLDSAIKMSVERGRGKLVKVRPLAHIDGCAALADAFCVRQKWWGEIGEQLRNTG